MNKRIIPRKLQVLFFGSAFVVFVHILLIAVLSGVSKAQDNNQLKRTQSSDKPASSGALVISKEDYHIGPNDVLEIQIEKAPELSRIYRVNANGTFKMDFLGLITAQQKTPEELASLIADGLRGRYLVNPQVSVEVKVYNSCSFFVQGSVRSPGIYQIEGKPSLLQLITI